MYQYSWLDQILSIHFFVSELAHDSFPSCQKQVAVYFRHLLSIYFKAFFQISAGK